MNMKVMVSTSNSATNIASSKKNTNKLDAVMNLTNTNSANKAAKKDDFKDVLKSTEKEKNDVEVCGNVFEDDAKANVVDADDINKKIDELEEKIDDSSEEEVAYLLDVIANMLMKLQENEGETLKPANVTNELLQTLLQKLDSEKDTNEMATKVDLSALVDKLNKLFDNEEVLNKLEPASSKLLEKLMSKLSSSIEENGSLNSNVKDILRELQNKIQEAKNEKTLSLEELLNKNNGLENNASENNTSEDDLSKQDSASNKDNEFLNKFLNKNSTDDKISMFTLRSSFTQNISANSVQANTITDVSKATFAKDLIQDIKYMATNSIKELIVKVNPHNLGEITIKISEENGIMKASLKANSKETTELMMQNVAEIKKSIDTQNIKIADVNIELYHDDTTFFKQDSFDGQKNEQQEKRVNNGMIEINEEIEAVEENSGEQSNVDFLA